MCKNSIIPVCVMDVSGGGCWFVGPGAAPGHAATAGRSCLINSIETIASYRHNAAKIDGLAVF